MKKLIFTLIVFTGLLQLNSLSAIQTGSGFPVMPAPAMALQNQMTVNNFLAFDVKSYRDAEGKKIGWLKRTAIQISQKNLAKKVKKGTLDGSTPVSELSAGTGNPNIHGLLSVIFGVVGLFIPYLGLPLIIAGLVLGIIGIKKDANPTLAIIGTAVCGAILFILILAIAILASGGFLWY